MISPTRREFLITTSLGLTGAVAGGHERSSNTLVASRLGASVTADMLLPASLASADLRALATAAIDTARNAGASYADVRVAERQRLEVSRIFPNDIDADTRLDSMYTYGLRVIVGGAWAFVHGSIPSANAMQRSAQDAVTMAKGYARLVKRPVQLIQSSVVAGEWAVPVQIDPFLVPLQEQAALLGAFAQAAGRVQDGALAFGPRLAWHRETRVFASSEGSLVTQVLRRFDPIIHAVGDRSIGPASETAVTLSIPGLVPASVGYETVATPALQDDIKRVTEEAVYLAGFPRRTLDVGRYPVVLDGDSVGMVLARTIGLAVELDRVLGYEMDASGMSFLSPPEARSGTPIVSSLLSVRGDRTPPSVTAVKWDDEGVESQAFPIITNGRLIDYPASRQTVSALRAWYESQGRPAASPGCAMTPDAGYPTYVRAPHLTVPPSVTPATLEDLCKEIPRGLLIRQARRLATDQQLSSASIARAGVMLEVERGRIVRRIYGNSLQLGTSRFWKALTRLGDASTSRYSAFDVPKGQPWHVAAQSATAPAGLFKEIDVVATRVSR